MQVVSGTAIAHTVVTVAGCHASSGITGAKNAKAGDGSKTKSSHDSHKGHHQAAPIGGASAELKSLAAASGECVLAGEACLEHCLRLLATGSPAMADCARTVQQMLPICRAMVSLAAMGSEYAKELASLCLAVCTACAKECEAHAAHHSECNDCFEACKKSITAVEALS